MRYKNNDSQADWGQIAQADPPHNSVNNGVCLYARFEKFWILYPQKNSKQKAWEEFQKINPSDELFSKIMHALQEQIDATRMLQSHSQWTPKWKYPASWIVQHCWEDEIKTTVTEETAHANRQRHPGKTQSVDPFWDSCKDGLEDESETNVIEFASHRNA